MKPSDIPQRTSSPEDTQTANRVKKRKLASFARNPKVSISAPQLPKFPSPKSSSPKPRYKRFKSIDRATRFSTLQGSLVTGKPVNFEGFISLPSCFKEYNLESIFTFEKPNFYYGLIGEFYCNLESRVDPSGNIMLDTTVTARTIVLNEILICRALNLSTKLLEFPKFSSTAFAFNKSEFQTIMEFLCGSPAPNISYEKELLISADFFTPPAQFIAQILRMNFLPRIGTEKLFEFSELKLIYQLLKRELNVNIPHLLLSHMVASNKANIMVYGLLLTTLFSYNEIPILDHPFTPVTSVISGSFIKPPAPLNDLLIVEANSVDNAIKQLVMDESIQRMFDKMACEVEKRNVELKKSVESLDKKLEKFQEENKKAMESHLAQHNLCISNMADLQNRILLLEQVYIHDSSNETRVPQNPNSDLAKLN